MKDLSAPLKIFIAIILIGIGVLTLRFIFSGTIASFLLLIAMVFLSLLRWRYPALKYSVVLDCILAVLIDPMFLSFALFQAMMHRVYWAGFVIILLFFHFPIDVYLFGFIVLGAVSGLFLGQWAQQIQANYVKRDEQTYKMYEMEALQAELIAATSKIEQMSVINERARIARDIHDNAGHDIVAAYISFQTIREELGGEDDLVLTMYDTAMERLDMGVKKMRNAVHNMSTMTTVGIHQFHEICDKSIADVDLTVFGDTESVPVHIWNVLETCLKESITNAAKHARGEKITVTLDVTQHLVRLCAENHWDKPDGNKMVAVPGSGIKNIRFRAQSVGGNASIDASTDIFRVVVVLPIKTEQSGVLS